MDLSGPLEYEADVTKKRLRTISTTAIEFDRAQLWKRVNRGLTASFQSLTSSRKLENAP
jgi:hypothetical protein